MSERLTFVTVVFDPEVSLLSLQARSMALWLNPESVGQIIVLDNCARPLTKRRQARLRTNYGRLADQVSFVRTRDLLDVPHVHGWRTQQAAKLLVAQRVSGAHYVVLDAKNHFVTAADTSAFVGSDGRVHGRAHAFSDHPLRSSLERTLRYLGADDASIADAVACFPPTGTPFVFETGQVQRMIADIEMRSGRSFAEEFESHDLLEFFLYSGWLHFRGPGKELAYDGVTVESPTIWPSGATMAGVVKAVETARADNAAVFGVHRRALRRADLNVQRAIAQYWVESGLFSDLPDAMGFITSFRRQFVPSMLIARGTEKLHEVHRRLARDTPKTQRDGSTQGK